MPHDESSRPDNMLLQLLSNLPETNVPVVDLAIGAVLLLGGLAIILRVSGRSSR
jgi:hypothetical protein